MTTRFLIVAIALFAIQFAYGQTEQKLNVVFQQASLQEVINYLDNQSTYTFSYSSSALPMDAIIDLNTTDKTVPQILDLVFQYVPVSYSIIGNRIVLSYSELTQTIRGSIIDKDTKQPILGATVVVLGSNPLKGATTDLDGNFRIEKVPVGRLTLKFNYLGYEEVILPNILLGSGKELVLNGAMVESVIKMEEIVVNAASIDSRPINEMAMVSGRSFSVEETKRFPISIGDPLRLASSFAGVMGTDDGSNEIIIRGNSPRGILWKMEGVEIPSPNHFSREGASTGGISMFSTQVLSRSDFYTGAFAPEYGNALSGVFDIHMRKGNNEKHEHTIQAGFLGLDIASEGPISRSAGSSYLFNYRYSTLSVITALGLIPNEDEKNIFQDLSLKVNLPTKKMGTFSIFGMGGLSSYSQTSIARFDDQEKYNMGVGGINHQITIGESAFLKTTLSVAATEVVDDYIENYDDDPEMDYQNITNFTKTFIRGSMLLNKKFNARHLVEFGTTISRLKYNFAESQINEIETPPWHDFERFDDAGTSGTQQAFVSWKYRISDELSLVNGFHFFRFSFNGETSFEPRSSLKWQFQPNQSFTLGFGVHSRVESLEYYLGNFINQDGTTSDHNSDLGLTKARHFVVGYDRVIGSKIFFKAEAYYQKLYNVPVATSPNTWFSTINLSDDYWADPLVNEGTGENYGIELTLDKKFSNNTYFLVNSSFFQSKYEGLDGIKRNTKYNGNFSHHALGGKEWKVGKNGKNNIFGLSFKTTYAGNQRYMGINPEASMADPDQNVHYYIDQIYTERFPNYFRFDLQLSFRKNKPKSTSEWRLDIQNLTSHNNYAAQYFDFRTGQVVLEDNLGMIPILSYRIEF